MRLSGQFYVGVPIGTNKKYVPNKMHNFSFPLARVPFLRDGRNHFLREGTERRHPP